MIPKSLLLLDKLEYAYIELKKDFKELSKRYSNLKKEHSCCNSKIDELLKLKDECIAILDSHKTFLEKLEEKKIVQQSECE